jgi:hypothetical protein
LQGLGFAPQLSKKKKKEEKRRKGKMEDGRKRMIRRNRR